MKLYATTTSERASKGQGGNDYLYIDLLVGSTKEQIKAGRISVTQNESWFFVHYHETLESDGITLKTILKGKQKKDELCDTCRTGHNGQKCQSDNCICDLCKSKGKQKKGEYYRLTSCIDCKQRIETYTKTPMEYVTCSTCGKEQ